MITAILAYTVGGFLGTGLVVGARWISEAIAKHNENRSTNAMYHLISSEKDLITFEAEQYLQDIDRMTRR